MKLDSNGKPIYLKHDFELNLKAIKDFTKRIVNKFEKISPFIKEKNNTEFQSILRQVNSAYDEIKIALRPIEEFLNKTGLYADSYVEDIIVSFSDDHLNIINTNIEISQDNIDTFPLGRLVRDKDGIVWRYNGTVIEEMAVEDDNYFGNTKIIQIAEKHYDRFLSGEFILLHGKFYQFLGYGVTGEMKFLETSLDNASDIMPFTLLTNSAR